MNTLMIREFGDFRIPDSNCFDLTKINIADCIGCWTCWWKTPGICIHEDLADFYRSYINADKVIIFAKLENGFVSSKLKTLLDLSLIHIFLGAWIHFHRSRVLCIHYLHEPDVQLRIYFDFLLQRHNAKVGDHGA